MPNRISHTFLFVLDQDVALDFYVGKLGMIVRSDADLGHMRFLTVGYQGQPDLQIVLMVPEPPAYDERTAQEMRELLSKGASAGMILHTDDCRADYQRLKAEGVEFSQEPIERFYGTDCAFRDPFGNQIRITQPPEGPVVVPSAEEIQAQG